MSGISYGSMGNNISHRIVARILVRIFLGCGCRKTDNRKFVVVVSKNEYTRVHL
jgi:hypothetical protein